MDLSTINSYETQANEFCARYAAADVAALHALLLRYLRPGSRVLEIGCGVGREAVFLAENGFSVVATDASAAMLAAARRLWPAFREYSPGCGSVYPPDACLLQAAFPLAPDEPLLREKFDAVMALAVLMHLPDQELFEFAYQVRQLLQPGGTVLVSVSEGHDVGGDKRDAHGRLFCERPAAEIALLFERLGFQLLASEAGSDGLGRSGIRWTTLVLRLGATSGTRPVDQIETIINRDRKTATYKLALLRALCDIAQNSAHHVQWHGQDRVSVPLGLVAERWLYYYWPLVEADITQIRGQGKKKAEVFRGAMRDLISGFRPVGGLDAFHTAYRNNQLTPDQRRLADSALNKLAGAIVDGPVTFAGGALAGEDSFFSHDGRKVARGKCVSPQGVLDSLGRIHMQAAVWRELCLVGHWIGEAILLRWAELTHTFTRQAVPLAVILEKLLVRPETERDVLLMKQLYASFERLECVWTGRALRATGTEGKAGFAVDHIIPFTLWHNNDLWNLVPADPKVNAQKSDRIVTRDALRASNERIVRYWQEARRREAFRFDCEVSRTLLGRNAAETQWEKPAFAALLDAAEMVAIQRGVERWSPAAPAALATVRPHLVRAAGGLRATVAAGEDAARSVAGVAVPPWGVLRFADIAGQEFKTALPLVAELAAGPLAAGFKTGSLDALEDCDWIQVAATLAKPLRFVVRVTGDSMEPTLQVGDLAVFEYHRTPRQDGQIVIAADYSAHVDPPPCAVKRYRANADEWVFASDNPARESIRFARSATAYPILGVFVVRIGASGAAGRDLSG